MRDSRRVAYVSSPSGGWVLAADHVRRAQVAILDDRGEVVRGEIITSPQHDIADLRADVLGNDGADRRLADHVGVIGLTTAARAAA